MGCGSEYPKLFKSLLKGANSYEGSPQMIVGELGAKDRHRVVRCGAEQLSDKRAYRTFGGGSKSRASEPNLSRRRLILFVPFLHHMFVKQLQSVPLQRSLMRNRRQTSVALLEEVLGNNARLLDDAPFFGTHDQPNKLRHAPSKRRCAARSRAKQETRCRRLRTIPHLFRNHAPRIREAQHRFEVWRRVAPGGDFIFAALARENRPESANSFAEPRTGTRSPHSCAKRTSA